MPTGLDHDHDHELRTGLLVVIVIVNAIGMRDVGGCQPHLGLISRKAEANRTMDSGTSSRRLIAQWRPAVAGR